MVVRSSNIPLPSTVCLDEDFDLTEKKGSLFAESSNRDSMIDPMRNTSIKVGALIGNSILNSFSPNKT